MGFNDTFGVPKVSKYPSFRWMNDTNLNPVPDATAFGTVTGIDVQVRREGDCYIATGYFVTGTTTANPAFLLLPPGITIDYAALTKPPNPAPVASTRKVGRIQNLNQSTAVTIASTVFGELFVDGSSTTKLFLAYQVASNAYVKNNASAFANSGDACWFEVKIPVIEFRDMS